MNILKKIQHQPEKIRKIILVSVVAILGLVLLTWWIKSFDERLKDFEREGLMEELKLPRFEEGLKKLPKIEMPEITEEDLKKWEETIKKME